jgi:hypothetical protein
VAGIGDLGGPSGSFATLVSRDGALVFGRGDTDAGWESIVWDEANGMRPLREALEADFGFDLTGWRLEGVGGVSDDGNEIAGWGVAPDGRPQPWLVTLVPEPGRALLLIVGAAVLAALRISAGRAERTAGRPSPPVAAPLAGAHPRGSAPAFRCDRRRRFVSLSLC